MDGSRTERCSNRTIAGGEGPGKGAKEQHWLKCLTRNLEAFGATDGSKEGDWRMFGIESITWTVTARKGDGVP